MMKMQHTLTALELNICKKKLENSLEVELNIYRIQALHSFMSAYFCIRFIDFMLKDKSLLDYTNLFFPSEYKNNDKIILKYFL